MWSQVVRRLKHELWRGLYRSRGIRHAVLVLLWPRTRRRVPDVAHLAFYTEENALGPLQREEALFLHALVRVLRPRVIVELGFFRGRSALNFLTALAGSGRVYSFDLDEEAEKAAHDYLDGVPNFRFARKSQTDVTAEDFDGEAIDLLFFDASHDFALNIETFRNLEPSVAERGVVVVHDTGTWATSVLDPSQQQELARDYPDYWLSPDEFAHRPDERRFVNWIGETYPDFSALHLHTLRTMRHGMTVLQRTGPLPVP